MPGAIGLELYSTSVPAWHVRGLGGPYLKVPCIWSSKTGRGADERGDGYRNVCVRCRRGTGGKKMGSVSRSLGVVICWRE